MGAGEGEIGGKETNKQEQQTHRTSPSYVILGYNLLLVSVSCGTSKKEKGKLEIEFTAFLVPQYRCVMKAWKGTNRFFSIKKQLSCHARGLQVGGFQSETV